MWTLLIILQALSLVSGEKTVEKELGNIEDDYEGRILSEDYEALIAEEERLLDDAAFHFNDYLEEEAQRELAEASVEVARAADDSVEAARAADDSVEAARAPEDSVEAEKKVEDSADANKEAMERTEDNQEALTEEEERFLRLRFGLGVPVPIRRFGWPGWGPRPFFPRPFFRPPGYGWF